MLKNIIDISEYFIEQLDVSKPLSAVISILASIALAHVYKRAKNVRIEMQDDACQKSPKSINVLFIDDKIMDLDIVRNLKRDGYIVDRIRDLESWSQPEYQRAKIIFIDNAGVGKSLNCGNGIKLGADIKRREGENKIVILYSSKRNGNIFNDDLDLFDDKIYGGASHPEFTALIDKYQNILVSKVA